MKIISRMGEFLLLMLYLSMLETETEKTQFTLLYEMYHNLMYYVAFKILCDEQLAEDAVHNAFIKLMYRLDTLKEIECHKTKNFIVIVVRNTALDIYRKRKLQSTVPLEEVEFLGVQDRDSAGEDFDNLKEAIKKLPDKLRDVIELKYYHHYSNPEIAKLLSVSEDVVRKRMERSKQQLIEKMNLEEGAKQ